MPLIEAADGRCFLLFTSHRALCGSTAAARHASRDLTTAWPLLVQGERATRTAASRVPRARQRRPARHRELLGGCRRPRARARARRHRQAAVRVAGGPAADGARSSTSAQRRQSIPGSIQLPQAVLALKQGVGRLIRDRETPASSCSAIRASPRATTAAASRRAAADAPVVATRTRRKRFLRKRQPGAAGAAPAGWPNA